MKERYTKTIEELKDSKEFRFCKSVMHAKSSYPRDKVPIHLFWTDPDNPKSSLSTSCRDCLKLHIQYESDKLIKKQKLAAAENLFYCRWCNQNVSPTQQAKNLDDSPSSLCISCKEIQNQRSKSESQKRVNAYQKILMEFIRSDNSSCYKCKSVYIKPSPNSLIVKEISTYMKDGKRYLQYDNAEYAVETFISMHTDLLELAIIDLDHLPECEQRERGVLKPDEPFVNKKGSVRQSGREAAMRLEASKCQHLCARCHVKVTMEREKGDSQFMGGGIIKQKLEYVNAIKINGCVSCGYKNPDLLRFFDMDHIDPKTKSGMVSCMARDYKCSVDMFIAECKKCQVLCRFCHRIHTKNQRSEGLFDNDELD